MTSSIYRTIFFFLSIDIGVFFNGQIRGCIDKYLRQDFLKEHRTTTNFYTHFSGLITTVTKLATALVADTTLGSFKTWLYLSPFVFLTGMVNIFSIFSKESRRLELFVWTKIIYLLVTGGVPCIQIPYFKYQLGDRKVFEKYYNIWYFTYNVSGSILSATVPGIFKAYVNKDSNPSLVIWFLLPPFIISMTAYAIFFSLHKTYKKENIVKKNLWVYIKTLISPQKINKIQAVLHNTQLLYLLCLFFLEVTWDIVMDLLGGCLVDFADDARAYTFKLFSWNILVTGQSLDSINQITVMIFTPIIFGLIYPYMIPKWSDYRKLTISLIFNVFSMALGGFLHCINPQKGGIDKSITHSILWHGLIVFIQALSEIIIATTVAREIAKHSPSGFENLCFALYMAANGVSSLICMIITKCKFIQSVNKISVYIIISLPGPYFAYKASLYNKDINTYEAEIKKDTDKKED